MVFFKFYITLGSSYGEQFDELLRIFENCAAIQIPFISHWMFEKKSFYWFQYAYDILNFLLGYTIALNLLKASYFNHLNKNQGW